MPNLVSAMSPKGYKSFTSVRCCEDTVGVARVKYENGSATFPEKNLVLDRGTVRIPQPPPRPRRIILVRHGQSEGNVDEGVYTRVADPKIGLTKRGMEEAVQCGRTIREMIERDGADDWKVYFYASPYRRTLETLRNVAKAFGRSRIAGVREEPRLREQDFGNFQDREQMKIEKKLRAIYGRFFYRFPNGESAADVYDRITGFRETLRADIDIGRFQPPGEHTPNMNLVLVSHGLTLRVFLMRWYKWTVEQFEGLVNMGNGKMIVMERGYGGRVHVTNDLTEFLRAGGLDFNLLSLIERDEMRFITWVVCWPAGYSLLVHHTEEELRKFGFTDEMLTDQEWQKNAKPGELNFPAFFTHLDDEDNNA